MPCLYEVLWIIDVSTSDTRKANWQDPPSICCQYDAGYIQGPHTTPSHSEAFSVRNTGSSLSMQTCSPSHVVRQPSTPLYQPQNTTCSLYWGVVRYEDSVEYYSNSEWAVVWLLLQLTQQLNG
jgi:hypothetical protein